MRKDTNLFWIAQAKATPQMYFDAEMLIMHRSFHYNFFCQIGSNAEQMAGKSALDKTVRRIFAVIFKIC